MSGVSVDVRLDVSVCLLDLPALQALGVIWAVFISDESYVHASPSVFTIDLSCHTLNTRASCQLTLQTTFTSLANDASANNRLPCWLS